MVIPLAFPRIVIGELMRRSDAPAVGSISPMTERFTLPLKPAANSTTSGFGEALASNMAWRSVPGALPDAVTTASFRFVTVNVVNICRASRCSNRSLRRVYLEQNAQLEVLSGTEKSSHMYGPRLARKH